MEDLIFIIAFIIICFVAFVYTYFSVKKEEYKQQKITDSARNKMTNHIYLEKGQFFDGWAVVKLEENRFAYVNSKGQFLNNEIFTVANDFTDGTAIVYGYKGVALIDKFGHYVIPFNTHTSIKKQRPGIYLYSINDALYKNKKTNYIVFIREDGSYVYSVPIKSIKEIKDNYIKFKSQDGIGELDFSGSVISRPFKYKVSIGDGLYLVQKESCDSWSIYEQCSDKMILPTQYLLIMECFIELKKRNINVDPIIKIQSQSMDNMRTISEKKTYSGGWIIKSVRFFSLEEQDEIAKAVVVSSEYGNSCCFFMKRGNIHFTPMSDDSTLTVGQDVDLNKALIITLKKTGENDIERIKL